MVEWGGGMVRGWISHAPDQTPLIATLFRAAPKEMLLVAAEPAAARVLLDGEHGDVPAHARGARPWHRRRHAARRGRGAVAQRDE
jgi:hypothetical protein